MSDKNVPKAEPTCEICGRMVEMKGIWDQVEVNGKWEYRHVSCKEQEGLIKRVEKLEKEVAMLKDRTKRFA
jgi:hypothetical protein